MASVAGTSMYSADYSRYSRRPSFASTYYPPTFEEKIYAYVKPTRNYFLYYYMFYISNWDSNFLLSSFRKLIYSSYYEFNIFASMSIAYTVYPLLGLQNK